MPKEHTLAGIPAASVPGWLSALATLWICSEGDPTSGSSATTMRWEHHDGEDHPVVRCGLDRAELIERTMTTVSALGAKLSQQPTQGGSPWKELELRGAVAAALVEEAGRLSVQHGSPVDELGSVFCRVNLRGMVALSSLLGGVTAQVRLAAFGEAISKAVSQDKVASTLFEPWVPDVGVKGGSLGFDWMTTSDASKAAGEAASLPVRDALALIGVALVPRTPQRNLLMWPVWRAELARADILRLVRRPELLALGRWVAARGELTRDIRDAARTLEAWSVTQVMVSRSMRRTLHQNAMYRIWESPTVVEIAELSSRSGANVA